MRIRRDLSSWFAPAAALAAVLALNLPAAGQPEGQRPARQRDAVPMPMTMTEMMRDCQVHMRDASQAATKARAALAEARKSGNTAKMQKAMADAEAALQGMTDQMGGCMVMMGPMGGGGGPERGMRDEDAMDRMLERHRRMHERMRQRLPETERPEERQQPSRQQQ